MFSPGIILRSVTFVVSVDFLGAVFARGYSGVRVVAFFEKKKKKLAHFLAFVKSDPSLQRRLNRRN